MRAEAVPEEAPACTLRGPLPGAMDRRVPGYLTDLSSTGAQSWWGPAPRPAPRWWSRCAWAVSGVTARRLPATVQWARAGPAPPSSGDLHRRRRARAIGPAGLFACGLASLTGQRRPGRCGSEHQRSRSGASRRRLAALKPRGVEGARPLRQRTAFDGGPVKLPVARGPWSAVTRAGPDGVYRPNPPSAGPPGQSGAPTRSRRSTLGVWPTPRCGAGACAGKGSLARTPHCSSHGLRLVRCTSARDVMKRAPPRNGPATAPRPPMV